MWMVSCESKRNAPRSTQLIPAQQMLTFNVATFLLWPKLEEEWGLSGQEAPFFVADTAGIAAFCVVGAQNGIRLGCHPLVTVICGMSTATFGGSTAPTFPLHDTGLTLNWLSSMQT